MQTKKCTKCGIGKELSEFTFRKDSNSYRNECKKCRANYQKEFFKKYPWKMTLINMKQRCENPNNPYYKWYGKKGIKFFLTLKDAKELWFRDKAWLLDQPSIDRRDSDKDYTLDNCQFIEMDINRIKDRLKPILQYDKNGIFIKEWSSAVKIDRILKIDNSTISKCCKGISNTAGGFIWKYKND